MLIHLAFLFSSSKHLFLHLVAGSGLAGVARSKKKSANGKNFAIFIDAEEKTGMAALADKPKTGIWASIGTKTARNKENAKASKSIKTGNIVARATGGAKFATMSTTPPAPSFEVFAEEIKER